MGPPRAVSATSASMALASRKSTSKKRSYPKVVGFLMSAATIAPPRLSTIRAVASPIPEKQPANRQRLPS
jgi:hypothetical protein